MKAKLLLCLALMLGGGWSSLADGAQGTNEPVGLRLTGHVSSNGETWPFEIVMEGYDRYYRMEHFPKPKDDMFGSARVPRDWEVLALDDLYDSKDRAYVARRLWRGDKFRGVAPDELRELLEYGHHAEEFTTPVSPENFPLPCVIQWTDDFFPRRVETYTIEKVEFRYQPDTQFWGSLREKYDKANHYPDPFPGEPQSLKPAEIAATNALQEAKLNPGKAAADLRAALEQFPMKEELGAWNQGVLLCALWQIRGLDEKDELVDWFYRASSYARDPRRSRNGDMDDGSLYLLYDIEHARRPETPELLAAIVADPRFDQTDAYTVVQLMDMTHEGYPLPKEIPAYDEPRHLPVVPIELVRVLGPQWRLLPFWRNMLRRHYGLPEEPLPVWTWDGTKIPAPEWGGVADSLQLACVLDATNGVLHCLVRNAGTNVVAYNDYIFGRWENLSLEIHQPTGWTRVENRVWFHGNGVGTNVPGDAKVQWLPPGQVITNTWTNRKMVEAASDREAYLLGIASGETFVVDLQDWRWRWPEIISRQGTVEARLRQIFRAASPDDPYPYMHGPDLVLFSPVFTMDCGMIQLFLDPHNLRNN